MSNPKKHKQKSKPKSKLTVNCKNCLHVVCVTEYHCAQYSTEQFCLSSLLLNSSKTSQLQCCLMKGTGQVDKENMGKLANSVSAGNCLLKQKSIKQTRFPSEPCLAW